MRLLGLVIAFQSVMFGCVGVSNDQQLEGVWKGTLISLPADHSFSQSWYERKVGNINVGTSKQRTVNDLVQTNAKIPTVIFMHPCSGDMRNYPDILIRAAFAVFTPDSFARGSHRYEACDSYLSRPQVMKWRHEEIRHTLMRLRDIRWVDQRNLFLVGFSEGGAATALYSGDEFNAYVIIGWSCVSPFPDTDGVRIPSAKPVLALRGELDPYLRGHCGQQMYGRANSRSIVYKGLGHPVILYRDDNKAKETIIKFLKSHLDGG